MKSKLKLAHSGYSGDDLVQFVLNKRDEDFRNFLKSLQNSPVYTGNKLSIPKTLFIVPFNFDSYDRLENLCLTLRYIAMLVQKDNRDLFKIVVTQNISGDDDPFQLTQFNERYGQYYPYFGQMIKDKMLDIVCFDYGKSPFSKTRLLNDTIKLLLNSQNIRDNYEHFCMYDTDVLLSMKNLKLLSSIMNQTVVPFSAIIPYNGRYNCIERSKLGGVIENLSHIPTILDDVNDPERDYNFRFAKDEYIGTGACTVFNFKNFVAIGGFNENFKRWGFEDDEIIYRLQTLGHNVLRFTQNGAPIHHINHFSDPDGFGFEHDNDSEQTKEFDGIRKMTIYELNQFIKELQKNFFPDNPK